MRTCCNPVAATHLAICLAADRGDLTPTPGKPPPLCFSFILSQGDDQPVYLPLATVYPDLCVVHLLLHLVHLILYCDVEGLVQGGDGILQALGRMTKLCVQRGEPICGVGE